MKEVFGDKQKKASKKAADKTPAKQLDKLVLQSRQPLAGKRTVGSIGSM